jgi:hypothetical protein
MLMRLNAKEMGEWSLIMLPATGGSITELSATDAWAVEPLSAILGI